MERSKAGIIIAFPVILLMLLFLMLALFPSLTAQATNQVVQNGGFETWPNASQIPAPWYYSTYDPNVNPADCLLSNANGNTFSRITPGHAGAYAFDENLAGSGTTHLLQKVALQAGVQYSVSGFFRLPTGSSAISPFGQIRIAFPTAYTMDSSAHAIALTTTFQEDTFTFTPQHTGTYCLEISSGDSSQPSTKYDVWVDDVSVGPSITTAADSLEALVPLVVLVLIILVPISAIVSLAYLAYRRDWLVDLWSRFSRRGG